MLNLHDTRNKISIEYGGIIKWKHPICVLPRSSGKDVPILECFDFEKKILEYGALGKETISNIYEIACGAIIEVETSNLYHVDDLRNLMKS